MSGEGDSENTGSAHQPAEPLPTPEEIAQRLACLPEVSMRAAVLAELLHALPPSGAAEVLQDLLCVREMLRPGMRECVAAVGEMLGRSLLSYDFLVEMYRDANERGWDELAHALLSTPPGAAEREPEPQPIQPGGRKMTLGERKALARRPERRLLERLVKDGDPRVIRILLGNRRLVEQDVVRMATQRPARPEVLREVGDSSRWISRERVRRALVLNPYTPKATSLRLVPLLKLQELEEVARSSKIPGEVVRAARRLLGGRGRRCD
jgi:hypothetical protein